MNYTFSYRGSEIFTGTYTNLIHMKRSISYHMNYILNITFTVAKLSTPLLLRTFTCFDDKESRNLITLFIQQQHYNKQIQSSSCLGLTSSQSRANPFKIARNRENKYRKTTARDRKSMETMDTENTSAIRHMFDRVQFRNSRGTVIR